ncbi:hypothetical protein ACPZ19_10530 [Amycolatopsis lurida]
MALPPSAIAVNRTSRLVIRRASTQPRPAAIAATSTASTVISLASPLSTCFDWLMSMPTCTAPVPSPSEVVTTR